MKTDFFWLSYRKRFLYVGLFCFAFCANFSISLGQIFLALSLFFWLLDHIAHRRLRLTHILSFKERKNIATTPVSVKATRFNEKETDFFVNFPSHRMLAIYWAMLAWFLLKIGLIFWADNWQGQIIHLRESWLMLILPLLINRFQDRRAFWVFIAGLMLGAAITGAFNVFQAYRHDFSSLVRAAGIDSFHHLGYAGITGLLLFAAFAFTISSWQTRRPLAFLLFAASTTLIAAGFALTWSRGAYLAVVIALAIYVTMHLRWYTILLFPLLLLAPTIMVKQNNPIIDIYSRALSQEGEEHYSLKERLDLWDAGLRMWLDHPLLGTTAGDYKQIYQQYKNPEATGVALRGSHMHNDFLNTLTKFGAIGLTIFMLFYLLPIIDFIGHKLRLAQQRQHSLYSNIMLATISALIAFALMGMSQCHFVDDEVQVFFWINLALYYHASEEVLFSDNEGVAL